MSLEVFKFGAFEYSHYSESDAEPKALASEARPSAKFLQLIKEGAQARQKAREEPAAAAAVAASRSRVALSPLVSVKA